MSRGYKVKKLMKEFSLKTVDIRTAQKCRSSRRRQNSLPPVKKSRRYWHRSLSGMYFPVTSNNMIDMQIKRPGTSTGKLSHRKQCAVNLSKSCTVWVPSGDSHTQQQQKHHHIVQRLLWHM